MKDKPNVEIKDKILLTLEEASAYSGIGINTVRKISDDPMCEFVLFIGRKRFIKRKKLEKYLEKVSEI